MVKDLFVRNMLFYFDIFGLKLIYLFILFCVDVCFKDRKNDKMLNVNYVINNVFFYEIFYCNYILIVVSNVIFF